MQCKVGGWCKDERTMTEIKQPCYKGQLQIWLVNGTNTYMNLKLIWREFNADLNWAVERANPRLVHAFVLNFSPCTTFTARFSTIWAFCLDSFFAPLVWTRVFFFFYPLSTFKSEHAIKSTFSANRKSAMVFNLVYKTWPLKFTIAAKNFLLSEIQKSNETKKCNKMRVKKRNKHRTTEIFGEKCVFCCICESFRFYCHRNFLSSDLCASKNWPAAIPSFSKWILISVIKCMNSHVWDHHSVENLVAASINSMCTCEAMSASPNLLNAQHCVPWKGKQKWDRQVKRREG